MLYQGLVLIVALGLAALADASASEPEGGLRIKPGHASAEASFRPWAGYGYPYSDPSLFKGTPGNLAPLEKYDLYARRQLGRSSDAALYERTERYLPRSVTREGRQHAWALASILAPEPIYPVRLGGITFEVQDQKALLTLVHENVGGLKVVGQKHESAPGIDLYDLRPEELHAALARELGELRRPFILDLDPEEGVWPVPVWKAQIHVARDRQDARVMHVRAVLTATAPLRSHEERTTGRPLVFEYNYDLIGTPARDGSIRVDRAEWTGRSRSSHPDFLVIVPPASAFQLRSANPEVDLATVLEITGSK